MMGFTKVTSPYAWLGGSRKPCNPQQRKSRQDIGGGGGRYFVWDITQSGQSYPPPLLLVYFLPGRWTSFPLLDSSLGTDTAIFSTAILCGLCAEDILENDFLPCWLYVRTHGKCKTSGLQIIKLSSFLLSPDHNIQHQTLVGRTLTKFGLAESSLHLSLQPRPGLDPPHSLHQLGNGEGKMKTAILVYS